MQTEDCKNLVYVMFLLSGFLGFDCSEMVIILYPASSQQQTQMSLTHEISNNK